MMKNIIYILLISLLIVSCSDEDELVGNPLDELVGTLSNISDVQGLPRVGAAVIKWEVPADSSFTYVEVKYQKNGKEVIKQVSKYADSLLIEDLINKEPTNFELRTVKETKSGKEIGQVIETGEVTPIKRDPKVTYFPDEIEQVNVTAEMLDTYTQEQSEGPKENLVDGNKDTYWHSAWSGGVEPLPHWIQVNFDAPQEIGAFKYYNRQNGGGEGDRPFIWNLEVSEDGENWETVWESGEAPTSTNEISLDFDQNFEATHFRFVIKETKNMGTFTHLGEIAFYKMDSREVDREAEAEEEYYNF